MQHELEKEQNNLKQHQLTRDEEIQRKMHHDETNLKDELNTYQSQKENQLDSNIAQLKNKNTDDVKTRHLVLQSTLKEETEKESNRVIKFKGEHENYITELKEKTENEILKNRKIINFSENELLNLGLCSDWDMNHLEEKTN